MSGKTKILIAILCVVLLNLGSAFALDKGATAGGPEGIPVDMAPGGDNSTPAAGPTPAEGEVEDEDEPILTVYTDPWAFFKGAATLVDLLFGSPSEPTVPQPR